MSQDTQTLILAALGEVREEQRASRAEARDSTARLEQKIDRQSQEWLDEARRLHERINSAQEVSSKHGEALAAITVQTSLRGTVVRGVVALLPVTGLIIWFLLKGG